MTPPTASKSPTPARYLPSSPSSPTPTPSSKSTASPPSSTSHSDDQKVAIGRSGAIPLLVALLESGRPRDKKDAATVLYALWSTRENKICRPGEDRAAAAGFDGGAGGRDGGQGGIRATVGGGDDGVKGGCGGGGRDHGARRARGGRDPEAEGGGSGGAARDLRGESRPPCWGGNRRGEGLLPFPIFAGARREREGPVPLPYFHREREGPVPLPYFCRSRKREGGVGAPPCCHWRRK